MNRSRVAALFGLAALLWQACGTQSAAPPSGKTELTWQNDPALAPLRAQFGAPNQNIQLNPRAFKVSDTPSVGDVEQILPDQLVIGAQHAAWLLARTPGDVLYCGVACGGRGFLRRIVGIHQSGNEVIVDTEQAYLTDIVVYGWLHGEFELPNPMTATAIPPGGLPSTPIDVPGLTGPTTPTGTPAPRTEKTDNESEPWKGGGEIGPDVSLNGTTTLSMKVDFDMAVTQVPVTQIIPNPSCDPCLTCLSCDAQWAKVKVEQAALIALFPTLGGNAPELTEFKFEVEPEIEVETQLTIGVTAAATYSKELYKSPGITLAPLVIGPVEIMCDLSIAVEAEAALEGEISLNGTVTNTYSANLGIEYTSAEGWQGIATGSRKHEANLNAKGEAAMKAGIELKPEMSDTIYGVVGPVFGLVGGVGAEVKVEATKVLAGSGSEECPELELEVDAYVDYGVQGGAEVKLFPFYTVWDKVVEDTLWSNTIEWEITKINLGQDAGACEPEGTSSGGSSSGGTSSGSGSGSGTGGGTGTTGSASGGTGSGGTTGGSVSTCNSGSGCGSGEVCIIPSEICGGEEGQNYCTSDVCATVGMQCGSSSDCTAGGATCNGVSMVCSDCSSLGCSGQCCNYGSTAG